MYINNHVSFELSALNRSMEVPFRNTTLVYGLSFTPMMVCLCTVGILRTKVGTRWIFFCGARPGTSLFDKLDLRNDHIDDLGKYVIIRQPYCYHQRWRLFRKSLTEKTSLFGEENRAAH